MTLKLFGSHASPYTMKMLASLRYLRLEHLYVQLSSERRDVFEKVKVPVIPIMQFADGRHANDSTPLLAEIDGLAEPRRRLLPEDSLRRFLALLVEDFADEWATKWMFHYRWYYDGLQPECAAGIMWEQSAGEDSPDLAARTAGFAERQISRMGLVGCTIENRPVVESSFLDFCALLQAHLENGGVFLLGNHPCAGDFALYGQLTQLASDPVPSTILGRFPLAKRWITFCSDLSGWEGEWADDLDSAFFGGILSMIAELYLPFLRANAHAMATGEEMFEVRTPYGRFSQGVFKYQVRCLEQLRKEFGALSDGDLARLREVPGGDRVRAALA